MSDTGLTLLVGTTKGAFLLSGGVDRVGWKASGPHCGGWTINHMAGDPETGQIWAAGGGDFFGAGVWRSENGTDWELSRLTKGTMDDWAANDADFAAMMGWTGDPLPFGEDFSQVWSISRDGGTLFAGTKPAAEFLHESNNGL